MIRYFCDGCGADVSLGERTDVYSGTGISIGGVDMTPPLHFCPECVKEPEKLAAARMARWSKAAGGGL